MNIKVLRLRREGSAFLSVLEQLSQQLHHPELVAGLGARLGPVARLLRLLTTCQVQILWALRKDQIGATTKRQRLAV